MSNISQNNGIEGINKEVSLLQDRLKINEKSLSQFQNALNRVGRIRIRQGQRKNLSLTKEIQKISRDIFKIKIKYIKKKGLSTKKCTCKCTKKNGII